MSGVGEWLTHGKLIHLVLLVETEGKTENVGIVVGWRSVVEHVAGGHSLPSWPGSWKCIFLQADLSLSLLLQMWSATYKSVICIL